jgi:hypothetical protein
LKYAKRDANKALFLVGSFAAVAGFVAVVFATSCKVGVFEAPRRGYDSQSGTKVYKRIFANLSKRVFQCA